MKQRQQMHIVKMFYKVLIYLLFTTGAATAQNKTITTTMLETPTTTTTTSIENINNIVNETSQAVTNNTSFQDVTTPEITTMEPPANKTWNASMTESQEGLGAGTTEDPSPSTKVSENVTTLPETKNDTKSMENVTTIPLGNTTTEAAILELDPTTEQENETVINSASDLTENGTTDPTITSTTQINTESVVSSTQAAIPAYIPESDKTTEIVTTTDTDSSSSTHFESNEIPTLVPVWFILVLDGNCSHLARGRQGQRENGLKKQIIENLTNWLETSKDDITIPSGIMCTPDGRIHANLTVLQPPTANISSKLKDLEDTKAPFFKFHGQEFYIYQIMTEDGGFLNKDPDIPVDLKHTDVELLVYITVGSTCTFLFLLAAALLMCKYCSCREQKPFEFGDTPNSNMRLEDYTLTRIPRPKLGYVDYCRGLTKRYSPLDDRIVSSPNGMVQPFDTSVVPLADARTLESRSAPSTHFRDYRDGIIVRPSDIHRLGGNLSRVYHNSCSGYRTNGFVMDADGYCVHSTENLHRPRLEDRYIDKGVDNPNFQ